MKQPYEVRGLVINLTGVDVVMVDNSGRTLQRYRSQGEVRIDTEYQHLGYLNGDIRLTTLRTLGLRGLPGPQGRTFYIVERKVARAAQMLDRSLDDLLVTQDPYCGNLKRELQGYRALMPAKYLFSGAYSTMGQTD